MKKELHELSDKQVKKMLPILKKRAMEMAVIRSKYKDDKPTMLRCTQQLQERTDKKLDAILTSTQKLELKTYIENY
ncbi:MAG: hypothetical protein GF372_02795 [Candidatus Marinimicrobia bacterium]|nr:hypothetical protein [Candidatus Neomarinimicrobiota bacterium]